MAYKRVMLKLSGEALSAAGAGQGIDQPTLRGIAARIRVVHELGTELVIVVGGGNIWRYRDTKGSGIERTASDAMGMLATIMNSVALQAELEGMGSHTRVMSAVDVPQLAEPYLRRRAMRHLEKGRLIICAGGIGQPYFTTDSAAALRALELQCEVLLKATNVDGIYDSDPRKNAGATLLPRLTYDEAIAKNLAVMDQAAFSLCRDQSLPIRVFNLNDETALLAACRDEPVGTLVSAA